MYKRRLLITHSLVLAVLALAGCGGEEERWEIAYSVVRDEVPTRIVVVEDDGTDARRVTGAKRGESPVLPTWAPAGERIAFVRYKAAGGPGSLQLFTVEPDGSNERPVGEGTLPVWTKDGKQLVVERPQAPPKLSTIHVVDVQGGESRRLTVGSNPAISHDGTRVAFIRNAYRKRPNGNVITTSSALYTIGLDGSDERLVAQTTKRNIRWVQPSWLPGDTGIALAQRTAAIVGSGPLLTFTLEGERREIVPRVGETYDWSPNGDLVAYTEGGLLFLVRPDGTEVESFGRSNAIDIEWSPDSSMVAYSIQEGQEVGQQVGLYLIDIETSERRRFVITEGFAAFLDWRPKPPEDS